MPSWNSASIDGAGIQYNGSRASIVNTRESKGEYIKVIIDDTTDCLNDGTICLIASLVDDNHLCTREGLLLRELMSDEAETKGMRGLGIGYTSLHKTRTGRKESTGISKQRRD